MSSLVKGSWKSVTVLLPLIGASVCTVLLVALSQKLSFHLSLGLLMSVLALVEVGYLVVLIVMNRRHGAHPVGARSDGE